MVTLKETDKSQMERLLKIAYKDDVKGLAECYFGEVDFSGAVQESLRSIDFVEAQTPLTYYEVLYENLPIGYFVFFKECLYSFCIAKSHRSKKGVLLELWTEMKKVLDDTFVHLVNKNNRTAVRFVQKMGMKVIDTKFEDKSLITFINI